jgi:hypothetical protein
MAFSFLPAFADESERKGSNKSRERVRRFDRFPELYLCMATPSFPPAQQAQISAPLPFSVSCRNPDLRSQFGPISGTCTMFLP